MKESDRTRFHEYFDGNQILSSQVTDTERSLFMVPADREDLGRAVVFTSIMDGAIMVIEEIRERGGIVEIPEPMLQGED